ncbi:hypothetical protein DB345_20760 [Spartobacteria bacterium LR76]|nr:hypothetical protein DB345_20760 [Spartobacteria bacterium LR76]
MPTPVFLTEARPLVKKTAEWLASQATGKPWDLGTLAVLLPTAGAGRRLRDELSLLAEQHGTGHFPPRISTPFGFIDALLPKVATASERLAAWSRAITSEAGDVGDLLPGFRQPIPARDSARLAQTFLDLCSSLAEAALTPLSENLPELLPNDADRWEAVAMLYRSYLSFLRNPDPNEARITAIAEASPPAGLDHLVIANVADLPRLHRLIFNHLEECGIRITVLVDAPGEPEVSFDAWGTPSAKDWEESTLPIRAADIVMTADAYSEAEEAARLITSAPGAGLCLADESLKAQARSAFARRNREVFDPQGEPLATAEIAVLTDAWVEFCTSELVSALAPVVQSPAFLAALNRTAGIVPAHSLESYDLVRTEMLIDYWEDVAGYFQRPLEEEPEALRKRAHFVQTVEALRREFMAAPDLVVGLERFVAFLYGDATLESDSREAQALRGYVNALREARSHVDENGDLLRECVRDATRRIALYDAHPADAVELNGWLEAPWLAEERLVLTGCTEGTLPSATNGHAFLPDSARETLGLSTNRSRFARDAFFLHNILNSRPPGAVKFLHGRTNAGGEPAKPSRLLLRCPPDELVTRVGQVFHSVPTLRHSPRRQREWRLQVPRAATVTKLPVTGFGDYLACPMRYYFKHVLGMRAIDPQAGEMNATMFGLLFHTVVDRFAKDEVARDSDDPRIIERFLHDALDREVVRLHGLHPSLPVRVQQESLRVRLSRMAEIQAEERAAGWQILHSEYRFGPRGEQSPEWFGLPISASLDRIEVHIRTGQRRILDYKTFARDKTPEEAHLSSRCPEELLPGEEVIRDGKPRYWTNLQLPLYRELSLFKWRDDLAPPVVGYFLLPERVEDAKIAMFDLDDDTISNATLCTEAIAERIARGIFWPPREPLYDDYESLFLGEAPEDVLSEESMEWLQGRPE